MHILRSFRSCEEERLQVSAIALNTLKMKKMPASATKRGAPKSEQRLQPTQAQLRSDKLGSGQLTQTPSMILRVGASPAASETWTSGSGSQQLRHVRSESDSRDRGTDQRL